MGNYASFSANDSLFTTLKQMVDNKK